MGRGGSGTGWSMSVWPRRRTTEGQDPEIVTPASKKAKVGKVSKAKPYRIRFDDSASKKGKRGV